MKHFNKNVLFPEKQSRSFSFNRNNTSNTNHKVNGGWSMMDMSCVLDSVTEEYKQYYKQSLVKISFIFLFLYIYIV